MRLKDSAGLAVGVLFVGAIVWFGWVSPFFASNAITLTCDETVACDQEGGPGTFLAEVCGRERVQIRTSQARTLPALSDPADEESDFRYETKCDGRTYFNFYAPPGSTLTTLDDVRRYMTGNQKDEVLAIYEDWFRSRIDTVEARQRLFALDE